MFLGQRRHLNGIVVNEGRLDELRLASLTEDFINQLALAHGAIDLHTLRLRELGQLFLIHFGNVSASKMLDSLKHGIALPRALEIDDVIPYLHLGVAMQCESDSLHHLFHRVHHPFIILVRHVQFHLGEFRIMETVHTFVAEVLGELIHAVESTHNQFFQIQLIGNTQIERHIQSVVVGFERTGGSTTVERLQNRGFDFQIALFVQIVTHSVHQQCALDEGIFNVRIHDEVDVTLTIALLRILESIIHHTVLLFHNGQRTN